MNIPENALIELIEGCLKSDRKCQKRIYEMLYSKMMIICFRYTKDADEAKDVLQEGFIKMFASISKYENQGSFEGWARRIIVNTSIDYFRKKKLSKLTVDSDIVERSEQIDEVDENDSNFKFSAQEVLAEIHNLSPAYQLVFNMYVMEGFTHKEIAEQIGISIGTSKSNLAKAKANIKKALLSKSR